MTWTEARRATSLRSSTPMQVPVFASRYFASGAVCQVEGDRQPRPELLLPGFEGSLPGEEGGELAVDPPGAGALPRSGDHVDIQ